MTTVTTNSHTLLVIDDDVMICEILERMLSDRFQVTVLSNPEEALNKVKVEKFDIVMTDFMMPFISGLDITHQVKSSHPETPVILITANGNVDEKIKVALDEGLIDEIIAKPFDLDNMIERLESYL